MSISENIAKYRKKKGFTQEQLGEWLGVSNQAVSKWELGVSMPDVMLLPRIAETLGITLNTLYGIDDNGRKKVKADDFPKSANGVLIDYFIQQAGAECHTSKLEDPWALVCISDICGAVYISKNLSFIECDYKASGSERVFGMDEIASAMKKLSDRRVREVLTYMYQASFKEKHTWCRSFLVSEICDACALEKDDALEVIEKIRSLNLLESFTNDEKITEYVFLKSRALYLFLTFRGLELLLQETHAYEVLRDTSTINDYAFEKLW